MKIGKGVIKKRSVITEEVDLSDVSDKLYEELITAAINDIDVGFWKDGIEVHNEWDKKKRQFKLVDMALHEEVWHPEYMRATIKALEEATKILKEKFEK